MPFFFHVKMLTQHMFCAAMKVCEMDYFHVKFPFFFHTPVFFPLATRGQSEADESKALSNTKKWLS